MSVSFSDTLQENGEKKIVPNDESSSEEDTTDSSLTEDNSRALELFALNKTYKFAHEEENSFESVWMRNLIMRKDFQEIIEVEKYNDDKWWLGWNEEEILIIERWLKSLKATGIGCLSFWEKGNFLLSRVAGKLALSNFLYDKGYIEANDPKFLKMIKKIRIFMNNTYKNEIFISQYCKEPFTSNGFHQQINKYIERVFEKFNIWQDKLVDDVIIPEMKLIGEFQQKTPEDTEEFWKNMLSLYSKKEELFKKYYTDTNEQNKKNCANTGSSRQLFSFNCKSPGPDNEVPVYFDDTTILWEKYKETLKDTTNLEELVKIQWQLFKVYENRLPDKNPNYLINVQLHAEMPIINIKHYNPKDGENCSVLCYWMDFLETLYGLIIFLLLSYLPITDIIEFEKDRTNIILLIEFFFNIIPLIQFISGSYYYNGPHFRGFLMDRLRGTKKRHNEFNKAPCHTMWITMGLTVSFTVSYALLLTLFYESTVIEILMGTFYCFWAVPSMVYNASLFYMVFIEHLYEIKWICKRVEEGYGSLTFSKKNDDMRRSSKNVRFQKACIFENFPEEKEPIDINELVVRISDFKTELETSIDAFNGIYSYSSLFGFVGTTFILATTVNNLKSRTFVFEFLDEGHVGIVAFLWSIIFCYFTSIAKEIEDNTMHLKKLLGKPFYTQLFLRRHKDIGVHANIIKTSQCQKGNLLSRKQTDITVDWAILNDVINTDWYKFNIFGFKIIPNIKKVAASFGLSAFVALLTII
tara:strand:+ start:4446 stop:6698 length:2253 start_codon:yes stop_codon:yes gene_type:complete